jgi:hypothetical protein
MKILDNLCNMFYEINENAIKRDIKIKLTGSVAIQISCPQYCHLVGSDRAFHDLDFATTKSEHSKLHDLLLDLGYKSDKSVYTSSEGRRSIYCNKSGIEIDIFYNILEFSHVIDISNRLDGNIPTLHIADLLLSKLQIHKINEKDLIDAIIILLEYDLGETDENSINIFYLSELCSKSWGMWRTVSGNLEKLRWILDAKENFLTFELRIKALKQCTKIEDALKGTDKSFKWRVRSLIGDKLKWYEYVEEI